MPLTHTTRPPAINCPRSRCSSWSSRQAARAPSSSRPALHCSDADLRRLIADVEQRLDCDSLSCAAIAAAATGVIHAPARRR